MFAFIKGQVLRKGSNFLIVENQGLGYRIAVPANLILSARIGDELSLHLFTYVREDQISLYGFKLLEELELFELLISVSGIGPKSALGILSAASPGQIRSAISSGATEVFTKISGIGRKTSERLIVELKERVSSINQGQEIPGGNELSESFAALEALGYKRHEIKEVLRKIPQDLKGTSSIVRKALRVLGGK